MSEHKDIFGSLNEKLSGYFSPAGKKIFLALVCLAVAAVAFLGYTFLNKPDNLANNPSSVENVNINADGKDTEINLDEQVNGKTAEIEIDDIEKEDVEKTVSLSVTDFGRANPFLPGSDVVVIPRRNYGFDLMAPPESLTEESEASKVMTTKVSGIMYDSHSPSAILNIENSDYLVRSGDRINNYKVLSITKDTVTVQLGSNVYKAGVGQMLADGEYNENKIDNLDSKFGGARK